MEEITNNLPSDFVNDFDECQAHAFEANHLNWDYGPESYNPYP